MKNGAVRCALCAFICALIVFGYFTVRGGGFFLISEDYNSQSLPFAAAEWMALRGGNGGTWCWNLDLGSSFITGFSFYNLASPFFLITLLFPKTAYPYLAGFLFVAKYVVAALSAYLYLNTMLSGEEPRENGFLSRENCAITGALLYAFSGYQTTNLIFHFHDITALFPLMLWGLEHIDDRKKRPLFALAVFLNCIVNYFFFVQEVVFLLIYYLFRHFGEPAAVFFKRAGTCLLYGALGTGMAAFLFLPNIVYIAGNERSGVAFSLSYLLAVPDYALFLLKGMLLPGDSMCEQSAIYDTNYHSASCFLPLFGLSLVFAYLAKKRDWLGKLLWFLLLLSFSPWLQGVFLLFTTSNQRWWFMLVLMMALATAKVLSEPDAYPVFRSACVYAVLITVLYVYLKHPLHLDEASGLVFNDSRFTQLYLTALAGALVLAACFRFKKERTGKMLLASTALFCVFSTALTLHWYRAAEPDAASYKKEYMLSSLLQPLNDQYRYALPDNVKALTGNGGSYGTFSSTIENSSRRFDFIMNVKAEVTSQLRMYVDGMGQLLGGKYYVTETPGEQPVADMVSYGDDTWYVVEGDAFPIGFPLDYYVFTDELLAFPKENRPLILMRALVIDPSDEDKVLPVAEHLDTSIIGFDFPVERLIRGAEKQAVFDFSRDSRGFTCSTAYDRERLVYFTVPYDTGWEARIDGEPVDILDTCGMMAIRVPEGNRSVSFSYETPWFAEGIWISVVSLGIWVVLTFSHVLFKKSA